MPNIKPRQVPPVTPPDSPPPVNDVSTRGGYLGPPVRVGPPPKVGPKPDLIGPGPTPASQVTGQRPVRKPRFTTDMPPRQTMAKSGGLTR